MSDTSSKFTARLRRSFLSGAAGLGLAAAAPTAAKAANHATKEAREFEGKTAFVTGGARGIGLACADALAKNGANVVLYDIAAQTEHVNYPLASEEDLARAKLQIEGHGVKCLAVKGDVRDGQKQKAAMQQAVAEFGNLDFVVANAGITRSVPSRFSATRRFRLSSTSTWLEPSRRFKGPCRSCGSRTRDASLSWLPLRAGPAVPTSPFTRLPNGAPSVWQKQRRYILASPM